MGEEAVSAHASWHDNSQSQFSFKKKSVLWEKKQFRRMRNDVTILHLSFHPKDRFQFHGRRSSVQTCALQRQIPIPSGQKKSKVTHDGRSPCDSPFLSCGTCQVHATGLRRCREPPGGPSCIWNITINFLMHHHHHRRRHHHLIRRHHHQLPKPS